MVTRRSVVAAAVSGCVSTVAGCSSGGEDDPCSVARTIVEALLENDTDSALEYHPYPYQDGIDEDTARAQVSATLIAEVRERAGAASSECGCSEPIEVERLSTVVDDVAVETAHEVRVDLSFDDGGIPDSFNAFVLVLETDAGPLAYPVGMESPHDRC